MSSEPVYVTVAEAVILTKVSERTIRRWMNARLLAIYRRGDGKLALKVTELMAVEREQRQAANRPRAKLRREYVRALEEMHGKPPDVPA